MRDLPLFVQHRFDNGDDGGRAAHPRCNGRHEISGEIRACGGARPAPMMQWLQNVPNQVSSKADIRQRQQRFIKAIKPAPVPER